MSDSAPRVPSAWQLEMAVSAWQQLRAAYANDPTLADDESVIAAALADEQITHPEVLLERAIDALVWIERREIEADLLRRDMTARRDRYRERGAVVKNVILDLMAALEKRTHRTRLANAVVAMTNPAVVILDADLLPDAYVRVETARIPDKLAIREAIAVGEVVPGASMSNAAPALQLRKA
jgi:Siphovirus Gp157